MDIVELLKTREELLVSICNLWLSVLGSILNPIHRTVLLESFFNCLVCFMNLHLNGLVRVMQFRLRIRYWIQSYYVKIVQLFSGCGDVGTHSGFVHGKDIRASLNGVTCVQDVNGKFVSSSSSSLVCTES